MKKTVTVNICGVKFTIDEDAYSILRNYLDTIKGYYQNSQGRDEIMMDIEARIAEMFQEKLSDSNQVISMDDVNEVIMIMGKPEDFIDDEAETESQNRQHQERKETFQASSPPRNKRLFRDGENNIAGGVCSGIGYYFGFDPIILRLLFAASFLFLGIGLGLYILLWIIIPKATTTAEKLEMKGERVNVDNISKAVEEEMENFKKKFDRQSQDWSRKWSNWSRKWEEDWRKSWNEGQSTPQKDNSFHQIPGFIANLLGLILKALGKIIGVVFLGIGIIILATLIISLVTPGEAIISITSEGINSYSLHELVNLFIGSNVNLILAAVGIILFIGTPALALIYGGIKLLFGIRNDYKGVGITFTSMWVIGVILCVVTGFSIGNEFKNDDEYSEIIPLESSVGDTLYIDINPDVFVMKKKKRHRAHRNFLMKIEENEIILGNPKLDIVKSDVDSFKVELLKYSNGTTNKEAREYAQLINYKMDLNGNTLKLDPYYKISEMALFRNQQIDIVVHVPQGKSVFLNEKTSRILYDVDNVSNTYDSKMVGKTWTMLAPGLTCIACDEEDL